MSVLSMPETQRVITKSTATTALQRCRGDEECAECQQARLQRAAVIPMRLDHVPPIVVTAANGSGQALDRATRQFMEERFGHDFGQVRVHTDTISSEAARAVGAKAYTVGQDVYFGRGRFDPSSSGGQRLLAHELAHTIQQRHGRGGIMPAGPVDGPDAPLELEAEAAAHAAVNGTEQPHVSAGLAVISPQRDAVVKEGDPVDWTDKDGKAFKVTRDLPAPQPCTKTPDPQSTPLDKIFNVDAEAGTIGFRYRYCAGPVELAGQLTASSQIYDDLRRIAQRSADLPDPTEALRNIVQMKPGFELTVSGKFHIDVSGGVRVGAGGVSGYDVEGTVTIKPGTWSLQITGDLTSEQLGTLSSTTARGGVTLQVGSLQLQGTVQYQQAGAAPGTVTIGAGVTLPGKSEQAVTIGGTLVETPGRGVTGVGANIIYGPRPTPVPAPAEVNCFICDCPAPKPHYHCEPVIEPKPPAPPALPEIHRLYYQWWSTKPAPPTETWHPGDYQKEVGMIADQIAGGYSADGIIGYASPEGKAIGTYDTGRGPTNLELSRERAEQARNDVAAELARRGVAASLPAAVAGGEILGFDEAGKEIRNKDLIPYLRRRLASESSDQQLRDFSLTDLSAADRAVLLKDISDFVSGRSDGVKLGERARWETIFPSLRRVDVKLTPPPPKPPPPPEKAATTDCPAEAITFASSKMPTLPKERRFPPVNGECKGLR